MRARGDACGIDQPRSVTPPGAVNVIRSKPMPKSSGVVVSPREGKNAKRDSIARTMTASAAMAASAMTTILITGSAIARHGVSAAPQRGARRGFPARCRQLEDVDRLALLAAARAIVRLGRVGHGHELRRRQPGDPFDAAVQALPLFRPRELVDAAGAGDGPVARTQDAQPQLRGLLRHDGDAVAAQIDRRIVLERSAPR